MKNLIFTSLAVIAIVLVGHTAPIQAQDYVGSTFGGSCPTCYGNFGTMGSPYALNRVPTPPYFALHPPVYYSQPVPRTYGYSPFAYPSTVMTPNVVMSSAQVLDNPHVTPAQAPEKIDVRLTQQQPLEILNPYVHEATRMVSKDVH